MYKKKGLPGEGDLVVCTVKKIEDSIVFVDLDEYENAKGIIKIDEIYAGRIRSIKDFVDVGRKIVCKVLKVDEGNRILDLSLRRVTEGLRKNKLEEFKKERSAYNFLKLFFEKNNIPIEKLHEILDKVLEDYELLYPFIYEIYIEKNKKLLEKYIDDKELANKLYKYIIENFVPPKIVRSGILTIYSLEKDGIKIIKDVLKKLKEFCEIKYKGAPEYYIKVVGLNVKEINNKLKNINKILEEEKKIYYEIKWEK